MNALSRRAFDYLRSLFFEASGIQLGPEKRSLVETRLRKRLVALELTSFDDYCELLQKPEAAEERQRATDLLTTNETYFFREPEHFQVFAAELTGRFKSRPVRVWSAACSTGEEPYSLAMTLLDKRPEGGWELRASDLATRVLERARRGIYPLQRLEHLPPTYLKRFFLRGTGEYDGTVRVDESVRRSVTFFQHNLLQTSAAIGTYEVIFLRNVLIYFSFEQKGRIVRQVLDVLRPRGLLFVGTAESLQGHDVALVRVGRSVFEKA